MGMVVWNVYKQQLGLERVSRNITTNSHRWLSSRDKCLTYALHQQTPGLAKLHHSPPPITNTTVK